MTSDNLLTEMIEYPANGATGSGYLARPDDGAQHPGVVVIQEWWGLEEHIKDVARRCAREGFVAIAPDLYHGQVTAEPDEARKLAMGLDRERAAKDMDGAVTHLQKLPSVRPQRVGMVGFCMGGSLTLFMACRNRGVGAAAVFYGGNPGGPEQLRQLQCPLFGAFGEDDESIPPDRIAALREGLQESGQPIEVIIYPGAPHSFFNDTRPSYRAEAAADAWKKTLTLFRARLHA
jgi:carboxymethylenebutenolidase